MPTTKKYKSLGAATETLRRFFANNPDTDEITINDIFEATGRGDKDAGNNMAWLSNKLTTLRYHNLVDSTYSYHGRRKLEKISLTLAGKRALMRVQDGVRPEIVSVPHLGTPVKGKVSINDALAIVKELKEEYPDFEIELTINTKR
jgi:hypothetical protein